MIETEKGLQHEELKHAVDGEYELDEKVESADVATSHEGARAAVQLFGDFIRVRQETRHRLDILLPNRRIGVLLKGARVANRLHLHP